LQCQKTTSNFICGQIGVAYHPYFNSSPYPGREQGPHLYIHTGNHIARVSTYTRNDPPCSKFFAGSLGLRQRPLKEEKDGRGDVDGGRISGHPRAVRRRPGGDPRAPPLQVRAPLPRCVQELAPHHHRPVLPRRPRRSPAARDDHPHLTKRPRPGSALHVSLRRRWPASVPPPVPAAASQGRDPDGRPVQRALLPRRAARAVPMPWALHRLQSHHQAVDQPARDSSGAVLHRHRVRFLPPRLVRRVPPPVPWHGKRGIQGYGLDPERKQPLLRPQRRRYPASSAWESSSTYALVWCSQVRRRPRGSSGGSSTGSLCTPKPPPPAAPAPARC
jgi:hypothetical protein